MPKIWWLLLVSKTQPLLIYIPIELNLMLHNEESDLLLDPITYPILDGNLVYITITRLDIFYAVQQVS